MNDNINKIKGLQEMFIAKLFSIASTEKLIEEIYPILKIINNDYIEDETLWDRCAEIVNAVNEYELYKLYSDKFHYNITYDFYTDTIYITETNKDNSDLILDILNKQKQYTFNIYKKEYSIEGITINVVFAR